ncbi:MAG TPA: hypothetical protein VFE08_07425, partial [Candidatus Sulfotelmatobacter sp.]|nr:hypothetical protein [Candidatus Sulfotelmatobacter sp.]
GSLLCAAISEPVARPPENPLQASINFSWVSTSRAAVAGAHRFGGFNMAGTDSKWECSSNEYA